MLDQPLILFFLGAGAMNGGIIQHHDGNAGRVGSGRQSIHEADHRLGAHRTEDGLVVQPRLFPVLQAPNTLRRLRPRPASATWV